MKTRLVSTLITVLCLLGLSLTAFGQVMNNASGQYHLTGGGSLFPSNFTIGNVYQSGSALNVHGELMGTQTGEVFSTYAPKAFNTYWRQYQDGTEWGNFFHIASTNEFNLNATSGNLRPPSGARVFPECLTFPASGRQHASYQNIFNALSGCVLQCAECLRRRLDPATNISLLFRSYSS